MKVAEGSRWIEISGALLAQIKGAMIGLEARAGIAWCQVGFKAMCRTETTGPPSFAVWPETDEYWRPSQGEERSDEDKNALRFVVEMVAACLFVGDTQPAKLQVRKPAAESSEGTSESASRGLRVLRPQSTDPSPQKKHKPN
jgi:hypothetical protein